jgi:RNA polymerase sigma-70 factor, ECF subfamily
VIRAELLRRLGRLVEAAAAYEAAIGRTENAVQRDFLQRQRDRITLASVQGRATDPE